MYEPAIRRMIHLSHLLSNYSGRRLAIVQRLPLQVIYYETKSVQPKPKLRVLSRT